MRLNVKLDFDIVRNCLLEIEAKTTNTWGGAIAIRVYSLTWDGHEFLDNVRSPKAVQHMKSVLSEFGSASIQVMSQIAFTFFKNQIGF